MGVTDSLEPRPQPVFTTDDFPERDRFDAFREEFGRRFMGLDIHRDEQGPFRAAVCLQTFGPLAAARISATTAKYTRTGDCLRDGDDSLVLNILTAGRSVLRMGSFLSDSRDDFGTLINNAYEGGGHWVGEGIAVRIPPVLVAPYLPPGRTDAPVAIKRDTHLARLLAGFVATLAGLGTQVDQEIGETVARHVVDLVALAFGATGEAKEAIEVRGVRAARRRAVLDEISRGFTAPSFNIEHIAARLGISDRYVRQLLEETGKPFSALVLERRLEWARRLLADPRCLHRRISDIAYEAGFSDLSYFNRSFRRRFGETPSNVRDDFLRGRREQGTLPKGCGII